MTESGSTEVNDSSVARLEERLLELEAKEAIREVLHRYCAFYDSGRLAELDMVFASHARLTNLLGMHVGSAAITAALTALSDFLPVRRHFLTNIDIHVVAGNQQATAQSYLFSIAQTRTGVSYATGGSYADRLELLPDGWRIVERVAKGDPAHVLEAWPEGADRFAEIRGDRE